MATPDPEKDDFVRNVLGFHLPPPGYDPPPEGVLRRAGDGEVFWQPNTAAQTVGGPPMVPAGAKWVADILEFYDLAPEGTSGDVLFNGTKMGVPDVANIVVAQAALSRFALANGDVVAAARGIRDSREKSRSDGDALAKSPNVITDSQVAELVRLPMPKMLDELEAIRKAGMLDAIAGRATIGPLRLGVLSVKHDLGDEWSKLMKVASDADQDAVRKHVYGSIVGGDPGDGPAPKVDGPNDGSSRPLTSSEIAYLKAVFHGTIDYSKVAITKGGAGSVGGVPRTLGNTINFPSAAFVDGTMELLPKESETLVHESTHVWQYQNRGWTYAPAALWAQAKAWFVHDNRNEAYKWRDAAIKHAKWDDLNPEQQAESVAEYNDALRNVLGGGASDGDYWTIELVKPWIAVMLAGPGPGPK